MGFLSENAGFVAAVKKAGLVFIGPDLHAIRVMGDKIESKALAISAGVSCVPGTDGAVSTIEDAQAAEAEIGYPVMVKASAGGGGKGMRVIDDETQMAEGMRAAMKRHEMPLVMTGIYRKICGLSHVILKFRCWQIATAMWSILASVNVRCKDAIRK